MQCASRGWGWVPSGLQRCVPSGALCLDSRQRRDWKVSSSTGCRKPRSLQPGSVQLVPSCFHGVERLGHKSAKPATLSFAAVRTTIRKSAKHRLCHDAHHRPLTHVSKFKRLHPVDGVVLRRVVAAAAGHRVPNAAVQPHIKGGERWVPLGCRGGRRGRRRVARLTQQLFYLLKRLRGANAQNKRLVRMCVQTDN